MNIVLLSGGSGKRLCPLSNDVRSKQFLKIFRRTDGTKESMVRRMHRMIKETDPEAVVVIRPGTKHAVKSSTELHVIEVQIGDRLTEDDIERLDWNWR